MLCGMVIAILLVVGLAACEDEEVDPAPLLRTYPGIQTNLAEVEVVSGGWTLCYSDTYANTGTPVATILAGCPGAQLMLACKPAAAITLDVAAHAPRGDVTFDTMNDFTTTHVANGVAWYFFDTRSWGFAEPGDGVNKNTCDTLTGAFPERRLCWHTGVGAVINTGFRCGTVIDFSAASARVIYTSP